MKIQRRKNARNNLGAGIAVITLVIGGILVTSLGFFSFEMIRHNTAHDELRSACEAAALAGAAAMASSDSTDPTVTHNNAIAAAQQAFKANTILGMPLSDANTSSMTAGNLNTFEPPLNKAAMFMEFLDPNSNPPNQPVPDLSSPNGRIVHVSAAFTNEPPLGKFFGLPAATIRTNANGRVPSLDVVMCFDCSGSIDDQTPVTFVRRIWKSDRPKNLGSANDTASGGPGAIRYQVCPGRSGAPTPGGLAQGRIYDILLPAASGTSLDACAPQNLRQSGNADRPHFSTSMRGSNNSSPPGNYPGGGNMPTYDYSDLVVNIDGKPTFGGMTLNSGGMSYDFPDVATLVEASRGNLESGGPGSAFVNSKAADSLLTSVQPKPGYRAAYEAAALARTQPIGAARDAAIAFFQIMNNNTDAHFGLVAFGTNVSTNPSTMHANDYKVDSSYSNGGMIQLPFPGVTIDKNDNKLSDVLAAIPKTQAHGSTNISGALQAAVNMLKKSANRTRNESKKAVIMFTDGQPTVGGDWANAANEAKNEGICIYTVGLAQNAAIIPAECENLNHAAGQPINYHDPITGNMGSYTPSRQGMAQVAGNGGKFFLVTNTDDLRYVFENIARHLVQLVKQPS